jgi:hypothetical protein
MAFISPEQQRQIHLSLKLSGTHKKLLNIQHHPTDEVFSCIRIQLHRMDETL